MKKPNLETLYETALMRAMQDRALDPGLVTRLIGELYEVTGLLERYRLVKRGLGKFRAEARTPRPPLEAPKARTAVKKAAEPVEEPKKAGKSGGKSIEASKQAWKSVDAGKPEGKPAASEVISAGAAKGAEIVAAAQKACKEAEERRAKAIEMVTKGPITERNAAKAAAREEDAALAFHKSALAYGEALVEAHDDKLLSGEETRALARLQAEMSLKRKKYEQLRAESAKSLGG